MKKLGLVTILSLGLAFSPLCALESKKSMAQDLSAADSAFLFSTSANALNVEALSEEEMRNTTGESIFGSILVGVGVGALNWGYNCLFKGNCKDWKVEISF